jgi:lipoate-protein ligase A
MAVDEALLDAYVSDAGGRPPTLRLYGWTPAALSLGRGQRLTIDADYLKRERIELVRRPTGGLSVLHDRERTYAVCGALRSAAFPGSVIDTYRRIARALQAGLRSLGAGADTVGREATVPVPSAGVAACFHAPSIHEITAGGLKLVGSAQLRRRSAFLQHGSIPVVFDAGRTAAALGAQTPPRATDLTRCLGRTPGIEAIDRALTTGFEDAFGVRCVPGALTDREHERAVQLYSWKYSSLAWTFEGRYGERERHWGPL